MREGRIGDFSVNTEKLVREIQHGKCLLVKNRGIRVFHHEPTRKELLDGEIIPDDIRFCLGLSMPGHAAVHLIRFNLFGNQDDWSACGAITMRMDEMECTLWDELVNGNKRREIEDLILRRRERYLSGKIRS